jgi:DNA-directed RNA polymerase subunit N (RpoN/RPB10)
MIPVRCVTCSNVLGDKERYFVNKVRQLKLERGIQLDRIVYLTTKNTQKTPEGEVLDSLGLFKPCCRRQMLTRVEEY